MAHAYRYFNHRSLLWAVVGAVFVTAVCIGIVRDAPAQTIERGLRGRKDILFFESFETTDWFKRWGERRVPRNLQLVRDRSADDGGRSVAKILFQRGAHYGSGWQLKIDPPLEEAYLRYYVKFDEGFDFGRGGKTPGLMGWAPGQQAGWGGRRANGRNGFSTRVCWGRGGTVTMYTYHADQRTIYGDGFRTELDGRRKLWVPGRWYCMELHMKLNTPGRAPGEKGEHDGIVELWLDGRRIGRRTDVRFRDIGEMKIDQLFVNAYFGGTWTSPKNQYIYYDNFVLARNYIGPVGAAGSTDTKSGRFTPPPGYEKPK